MDSHTRGSRFESPSHGSCALGQAFSPHCLVPRSGFKAVGLLVLFLLSGQQLVFHAVAEKIVLNSNRNFKK